MIDADFNCWLIEVNSSPELGYTTPVTEKLVKLLLEDIVKVVIDYDKANIRKKSNVDTGLWKCIYKAKQPVTMPKNSFNLKLDISGKAIKKKFLSKI